MNRESVPINLAAGGHNNITDLRTVWGQPPGQGGFPMQTKPGNAGSGAGQEAQPFHQLPRVLTELNPPEKQFPGMEEHCWETEPTPGILAANEWIQVDFPITF